MAATTTTRRIEAIRTHAEDLGWVPLSTDPDEVAYTDGYFVIVASHHRGKLVAAWIGDKRVSLRKIEHLIGTEAEIKALRDRPCARRGSAL
jgi:hypothetical protein